MLVIEVQLILVSSYPCATSKCNLSFGAIYPSGAIYPLVQLMKMYNFICHKNPFYSISCAIFILNLTTTTCLGRLLHARYPRSGSYASFSFTNARVTFSTNERHVVRGLFRYLATRLVRYSVLIYSSRTHTILHFGATLSSRVATTINCIYFHDRVSLLRSVSQRVANKTIGS